MARLDPSIRHAITPPEFGEDKLHRAELVDRLHGEIPRKLVAIAAPAGYGKTTLLADFAAHTDIPVVWVQVTESDQDLMRLVSVIIAAMEKRFRRLRDKFGIEHYSNSKPEQIAAGFVDLIDQFIPESFVLVIDDVHWLHETSDVMAFMDHLLMNLPEQATLVASGREVLEVSLARLMAEGELAGFGPHDLALSWSETATLLRSKIGVAANDHEINDIHEFTRGWVTGVVLSEYGASQLSLEAGLSEAFIYEYLSSVVLNRQSDALRRFMLDASVLPLMTSEICNAVLGIDSSDELLSELASRNLFISFSDDEQRTYEFHPIFRTHLTKTLKAASPERYLELQTKAAEHIESDSPEIAVDLFLELGDDTQAARIAEREARDLHLSGRYETIKKWFYSIRNCTEIAPKLSYHYAIMEGDKGKTDNALDILREIIGFNPPEEIHCLALIDTGLYTLRLGESGQIDEIIENAKALLLNISDPSIKAHALRLESSAISKRDKDHNKAGLLLDKALTILDRTSNLQLKLKILQDQSLYFGTAGEWARARNAILNSVEIADEIAAPPVRIASYINLGYIEYIDGKFNEALQSLDVARGLAVRAGSPRLEAQVLYTQGDIFCDVGFSSQAGLLYEEGLNLAASLDDRELLSYGSLGASVLHRRNGNHSLSNEWLNRASEIVDNRKDTPLLIQKASLILGANPKEAIRILTDIPFENLDQLSAQERVLRDYFLARSYKRVGKIDEARQLLIDMVEIATLRGGVQYLAAELFADSKSRDWVHVLLRDLSSYSMLYNQLEKIVSFNSHYSPREESTQAGLLARALGGATLEWGGAPIEELKPQAAELFFLLIDQVSVDRDRIVEEFWPDHPPGRQTANLHMAVYSIRRSIGKENIQLNGTKYCLAKALPMKYDVKDFEQAAKVFYSLPPGDPRRFFALTEAVNLYEGHFLPEYYSEWVEQRRRELELTYLDIASHHADESIIRKQPSQALPSLRNALSIDPYRDDLNQRYLQALLDLGRRSDILAHYQNYREMLESDLGLEPADSVKEIYDRAIGS